MLQAIGLVRMVVRVYTIYLFAVLFPIHETGADQIFAQTVNGFEFEKTRQDHIFNGHRKYLSYDAKPPVFKGRNIYYHDNMHMVMRMNMDDFREVKLAKLSGPKISSMASHPLSNDLFITHFGSSCITSLTIGGQQRACIEIMELDDGEYISAITTYTTKRDTFIICTNLNKFWQITYPESRQYQYKPLKTFQRSSAQIFAMIFDSIQMRLVLLGHGVWIFYPFDNTQSKHVMKAESMIVDGPTGVATTIKPVSAAFLNSEVLLVVDAGSHTVRVYNEYDERVSSICKSSPQDFTGHGVGDISACKFAVPNFIAYDVISEGRLFILGGYVMEIIFKFTNDDLVGALVAEAAGEKPSDQSVNIGGLLGGLIAAGILSAIGNVYLYKKKMKPQPFIGE